MATSTTVPQAQAAVDRGLFLYYAYNGDDAARAFAQATEYDPHLAIAYWGAALANGPDLNTPITEDRFARAATAMRTAVAMKATASPLERSLIEAMAARYKGSFPDWNADDAAYRAKMVAIAESTRDENAELLASEALLEHGGLTWRNGSLADDGSQMAMQFVNAVLSSNPSSVMANHLCIHLYDLAPDRTPAQPCAQRLDATNFPPEAEHLAHMPAHYWIEVGNYAAALGSSERAYDLLHQLVSTTQSAHGERYAKHDVAVGYSAAMMLGNYDVAMRWSQRMTAAFGTPFDGLTALRFGRYATAFATDGVDFADLSVRGLAALHEDRTAEARALANRVSAGNTAQGYLPQLFLAQFAEAQGNHADAERWIDRARSNQQTVFSGELIPLIPADEVLGSMLLRRGDNAGAAAAFTTTLAAYPNDPRALFGLAQAQAAIGQNAQASATRARFASEWKDSDTSVADALL